jgi:hypothetical protein
MALNPFDDDHVYSWFQVYSVESQMKLICEKESKRQIVLHEN